MGLKKSRDLNQATNDAGFTLVEVLVAVVILSIMGMALWGTFAGGLKVLRKVPELGDENISILLMEKVLRQHCARVRPPYWLPELEIDRSEPFEIPYYRGYKDYILKIYTEMDTYSYEYYLVFEGFMDEIDAEIPIDEEEFDNFKQMAGPFEEIRLDRVDDDDNNFMGVEVWVKTAFDVYGEVLVFGRIGGEPLWAE